MSFLVRFIWKFLIAVVVGCVLFIWVLAIIPMPYECEYKNYWSDKELKFNERYICWSEEYERRYYKKYFRLQRQMDYNKEIK